MKPPFAKLQKLSFRSRIIFTFTIITAILVIIISRVGYLTVKEIYLNQLNDQAGLLTRLIAANLDPDYLAYLEQPSPRNLAADYYRDHLQKHAEDMALAHAFIFNSDFNVRVQIDTPGISADPEPALLLNRRELGRLSAGQSMISLPFKGFDGRWYLWGFYRLDDNYYLGIQENAARFSRVDQLSKIFLAMGLSGILLTILAGWLLANALAKPINKLVDFSGDIGQGNFAAPLPEGMKGELAALAGALDKMRGDLERNHREKEEMLAQIAHEIRNPLGGIELLAGLVKEDLKAENRDTDYVENILREIAGLKLLINAYLNYSRPIEAHPIPVEIEEIIGEMKTMFGKRLQEQHATLSFSGEAQEILFDPNHLRQIFTNLIANSLEHGGSPEAIRIHSYKNGKSGFITVSDNGAGIPENDIEKIFEPFFSTRPDGSGLGLSICKKLCEENGASITVKNNAERGCTFIIQKNNNFS
ncbi:MAG: HAMP domain-containing sensor histidine kinase [Calditrichia bacterium]